MTADQRRWILGSVSVTDFLAFQGMMEITFENGLHVIDAPNHTGKTSLTLAILWCITGEIPSLSRINKGSFRLFNRHRGENHDTRVELSLRTSDGSGTMKISRKYSGRKVNLDEDLSVQLNGESMVGEDAGRTVGQQLGVATGSLEGCGVVLQDHRLKLITGKSADIGDVINDMLGLYNLSRLAPVLDEKKKQALALSREVIAVLETADPLARWEEMEQQLVRELRECEDRAVSVGYAPESFEVPAQTAASKLSDIVADLEIEAELDDLSPQKQIQLLREKLGELRASSPISRELSRLKLHHDNIRKNIQAGRKSAADLEKHTLDLEAESARGEMNPARLESIITESRAVIDNNRVQREQLCGEQRFVQSVYEHLLSHGEAETCPVCESPVEMSGLMAKTRDRLEDSIAGELDRMDSEDRDHGDRIDIARQRQTRLKDLSGIQNEVISNITTFFEQTGETSLVPGSDFSLHDMSGMLSLLESVRQVLKSLGNQNTETGSALEDKLAEIRSIEEKKYQPAEVAINSVNDHILPVITAHEKINAHADLRDSAQDGQNSLRDLESDIKTYSGSLKQIHAALVKHEEDFASRAVNEQMETVSGFFRDVAENPDYDGLTIDTNVKRDKVDYSLRATSSQVGTLDDAVGHVLSEGDLSAAGMALLMGLATGRTS